LAILHLFEAERVAEQAVSRNASTRTLLSTLMAQVIRVRAEEPDTETAEYDKPAPRFAWRPVVEAVARSL
jgi:hypothetical protein